MVELERRRIPRSKVLLSLFLLDLVSCSHSLTTREKGTLTGGGIGTVTGAAIGATVGAPLIGAAIGGGTLGAAGALISDKIQTLDREQREARQHSLAHQDKLKRQRIEASHPLLRRQPPKTSKSSR